MNYNKKDLTPYLDISAQLMPLFVWNKQIKGDERGKTPIHSEWTTREYLQTEKSYNSWVKQGFNIGFRIQENELIIDLDPRNYVDGINSEELIADLMGYFDFEELMWELPVVKTGGGGYHIYCLLPTDVDYKLIRKCIENIPGVDFKKKGGYVVAAGSKHPNGEYYYWENEAERQVVTPELLNLIKRDKFADKDYTSGYGAFNGTQLQHMVLDKLEVTKFSGNDEWEPLMMECHHATAGDGIEEFLAWCLQDPEYQGDDNKIRNRWESLDDTKEVQRTAGSLIRRLKQVGEDITDAKAVLDFGSQADIGEIDDDNTEEAEMLKAAKEAAANIDVDAIVETPKGTAGVEGAAMDAARALDKHSHMDDKMKCIRLIKAASIEESIEAQEVLTSKKVMSQAGINKRLKALEAKILDSVTEILANTTIETVFKKGKHILTEPNKQSWVFNKTHWKPLSELYLGKMIYGVLDILKTKMQLEVQEVNLVTSAVKGVSMRSSVLSSRLFNNKRYLPVINCANGEVWIDEDGGHTLKSHTYRSYQLRCLSVDYDPGAKCPLFMQTLEEIFANYIDGDEMIRHLGEVMGYIIQPYKPDASCWLFRGPGGDGKSTIIKTLDAILGDAYYSADEGLLASGSGGGNAHALVGLVGKLAVVMEELTAGKMLKDAGIKMLSENTKLTANPKNKDEFDFYYVGSLIMCSNSFPGIKDTSEGMRRRLNVIPFNRQFVKEGVADLNRSRKILKDKQELAGVLNFMLEGYNRYVKRGQFLQPESCIDAKEEWLSQANNVVRFVKENIKLSKCNTDRVNPASVVYLRYERWCENNGVKAKGRNNFYIDLSNLGINKKVSSGGLLWLYGGELLEELIEDFDFES